MLMIEEDFLVKLNRLAAQYNPELRMPPGFNHFQGETVYTSGYEIGVNHTYKVLSDLLSEYNLNTYAD